MFSHNGPHELVVTCDIGHNLRERRAGGSRQIVNVFVMYCNGSNCAPRVLSMTT